MSEVFTIISLVVGVSGGTFMVIAAIRDLFKEKIWSSWNDAHRQNQEITSDTNALATSIQYCQRDMRLLRLLRITWNGCSCAPIVLFGVFIFVLAYHSCAKYPSVIMGDDGVSEVNSLWNIYQPWLWWFTTANLLFVCGSVAASCGVFASALRMNRVYSQHQEHVTSLLDAGHLTADLSHIARNPDTSGESDMGCDKNSDPARE